MNLENLIVKLEPDDIFSFGENSQDSSILKSSQSSIDVVTSELDNNSSENMLDFNSVNSETQNSSSSETSTDNMEDFYFETDHPALKVNEDYKRLLQAMSILQAQRCKAIKDLDRLYDLQKEALSDPIGFVERLQRNEDLDIPGPQMVHPVPVVDWSKYSLTGNASAFGRRQLTRLSAKVSQDFTKNIVKGKSSGSNDQKQQKASQYWSVEEQRRLEELLVQFPPEEVETRRWEKIANCLENRTPIQVASRVQKYFIKLMKAGIPVPGRTPSTSYLKKPRRNVIRQNPSTFLVSHSLPVYMPEVDEDYGRRYTQSQNANECSRDIKTEISDEEDITPELHETPDFQELKMLKKVLRDKLKTCGLAEHIGYKCSRCKADPIIGVRWHCTVCKPPLSVNLCDDCAESKCEIGNHSIDHRLEEIPNASSETHDHRNENFVRNDYNYLDPNYMPAI